MRLITKTICKITAITLRVKFESNKHMGIINCNVMVRYQMKHV